MNMSTLLRPVTLLCLCSWSLVGCVGVQSHHTNDQVPSWMKYSVTGSRIQRPRNAQGQVEAGDYVTKGSAAELTLLPWVRFH